MNNILTTYFGPDFLKITQNPKLLKKCINHPLFHYQNLCSQLNIDQSKTDLFSFLNTKFTQQINYKKIRFNLSKLKLNFIFHSSSNNSDKCIQMDCSEYSAIQGALSATLSNSISSLKLSIPGNCSNSSFCEFSSFDNSEKMEEGEVVQGFDKLFEGDNS